tara:strand:+ start:523 stop:819 length:297 start_codon:yes stop_codon:yes gene_type:complete
MDKAMLGTRYTCFTCGTKFYDLNRPEILCPECGADQANAPVKSTRDLLKGGKRRKKQAVEEEDLPSPSDDDDDDVDDVDDLFDDDDDDDDMGDDDDDS